MRNFFKKFKKYWMNKPSCDPGFSGKDIGLSSFWGKKFLKVNSKYPQFNVSSQNLNIFSNTFVDIHHLPHS